MVAAHSLETGGYPLIILLMAIESSLLPLPSELVIPPAAFLAYSHRGEPDPGRQEWFSPGTLGSMGLGATAMYWASLLGGP